ncbi:MAG TPA: DUF423 domain-containing protein [Prolixibacteraceae bacterium]|jgi:uncharacterized membrane protein YgdD (TMEM256/DUF423 family)
MKKILISGALLMALCVLLGAFGAHALKTRLSPDMLEVYKTAVDYQFYHSLGLLLIGLIGYQVHSKWIRWSAVLLLAGIILFSGSLYALSTTGVKALGAITPIGGLAFVAGWICLGVGIWKNSDH